MLPPPPPSKRGFRLYAIILVLVALLLIPAVLFYSGVLPAMFNSSNPTPSPFVTSSSTPSSSSVTNSPGTTPQVTSSPVVNTPSTVSFATGSKVSVASSSVGASGGTIEVTDSSSPLYGLKIVVPEAATTEPVQFDVSYSTVSSVSGLQGQAFVASKMITVSTSGSASWNQFKVFDKPVEVTFPYDANAANNDNSPVRFYWYDGQTGKLDATGFLSEDKTAHTITFLSASFSDFVAIRLDLNFSELLGVNYQVDTGFRPSSDGWFIPNYGSYLTSGGMCLGMVSYAKWYFSYMKGGNGVRSL